MKYFDILLCAALGYAAAWCASQANDPFLGWTMIICAAYVALITATSK